MRRLETRGLGLAEHEAARPGRALLSELSRRRNRAPSSETRGPRPETRDSPTGELRDPRPELEYRGPSAVDRAPSSSIVHRAPRLESRIIFPSTPRSFPTIPILPPLQSPSPAPPPPPAPPASP